MFKKTDAFGNAWVAACYVCMDRRHCISRHRHLSAFYNKFMWNILTGELFPLKNNK